MTNRSYQYVDYKGALKKAPTIATCCVEAKKKGYKKPVKPMKVQCFFIVMLLVFFLPWSSALVKADDQTFAFNIPQQSADGALTALADQADISVVFDYDAISQYQANPLKGRYTAPQAVELLLKDTELIYEFDISGHLIVTLDKASSGDLMMGIVSKKKLLASMVAFFVGGVSQVGLAQDKAESKTSGLMLEEIVITAQKREQDLQEVAIAVTALNSDALEARGVSSAYDLQFSVPGLTLGNTIVGAAQVTLRGVGMENIFLGGDPGVPMHIDGHYLQSTAYMLKDFLDIDRVEVLRGPQGTLYGRNAIGGSINIITKRPTEELEGMVKVDIGNYNKRLLQGVVSGALTDNLRARLVASDNKRDGYIENVSSLGGDDLDDSNYTSIRASLEYDIADNVTAFVSGYHYKDTGKTVTARWDFDYPDQAPGFVNYFELNGAGTNITASDPRKVRTNDVGEEEDNEATAEGVSIDIDWEFDTFTFRSLTAYNKNEHTDAFDSDNSDVVTVHQFDESSDEIFTQELQLVSDGDGDLKWILGVFYYDENGDFKEDFDWDNLTTVGGPKFIAEFGRTVEAESKAIFGQADYSLTEKIELILGLRYTEDEKTFTYSQFIPSFGIEGAGGGPLLTPGSDEWSKTSGKLGINYYVNEGSMLYASYSSGYKSGGFNATAPSYDPETVDAYELGLKSVWNDRQILTNISAFYYDYSDKQEFKRDPGIGFAAITNAGTATIWGVELEANAKVTEAFLVDLSVAYLNAEYDEFDTLDGTNPVLGIQDLSGNSVSRSPEWKVHLGAEYGWSLGESGDLTARVDATWVDDQYSSPFNRPLRDDIPSYHRTNAQLRWDSIDQLWQVSAYVRNIEDDDVVVNRFDQSSIQGFPSPYATQYAPPRTYGLAVTRNF